MIRIIISIGLIFNITLFATSSDNVSSKQKSSSEKIKFYKNKKACKNKKMRACIKLGVLYATGKGVKQNEVKAKKLFTKACKKNYSQACYLLGTLYLRANNKNIQDKRKAKLAFGTACNLGHDRSCELRMRLDGQEYTGYSY